MLRFSRVAMPLLDHLASGAVTIAATDTPPEVTTEDWQFTVPTASRSFTYDANGNTLTDGVRTMTWDAKNRLKTVTVGANTWKWDYDYRDRRVKEYLNTVETKRFIWSGNQIIQERTAANAITRTHYFGGFSDGAAPTTGTKYQNLTDHLGNIREVLTTTGTVAARYDYTPYQGPVAVGTPTVTPTFLTIGRYYHHTGSGLELALYRAYDPELGRWMNEDPLGERGGPNLFQYVGNSPLNRFDELEMGVSRQILTNCRMRGLDDGGNCPSRTLMTCDVPLRFATVPRCSRDESSPRPQPSLAHVYYTCYRPRLPPSAFRLPPSAFRLPPSAFRLPHHASRITHHASRIAFHQDSTQFD